MAASVRTASSATSWRSPSAAGGTARRPISKGCRKAFDANGNDELDAADPHFADVPHLAGQGQGRQGRRRRDEDPRHPRHRRDPPAIRQEPRHASRRQRVLRHGPLHAQRRQQGRACGCRAEILAPRREESSRGPTMRTRSPAAPRSTRSRAGAGNDNDHRRFAANDALDGNDGNDPSMRAPATTSSTAATARTRSSARPERTPCAATTATTKSPAATIST